MLKIDDVVLLRGQLSICVGRGLGKQKSTNNTVKGPELKELLAVRETEAWRIM